MGPCRNRGIERDHHTGVFIPSSFYAFRTNAVNSGPQQKAATSSPILVSLMKEIVCFASRVFFHAAFSHQQPTLPDSRSSLLPSLSPVGSFLLSPLWACLHTWSSSLGIKPRRTAFSLSIKLERHQGPESPCSPLP